MLKRVPRKLKIFLSLFLIFIFLITAYYVPKVLAIKNRVSLINKNLTEIKQDVETLDFKSLEKNNWELNSDFKLLKEELNHITPINHLPYLNKYYSDADHILNASIIATNTASSSLKTFLPLIETLGFTKGKKEITTEEKIQLLVRSSSLVEKEIQIFGEALKEIKRELDQVDVERYPTNLKIKGKGIKEILVTSKDLVKKAEHLLPQAKEIVDAAPKVLGLEKEKTYLVWLQNNNELRATGGFITSVILIKVKNGKLTFIKAIDSRKAHENITKPKPPEPLAKYLGVRFFYSQDANLSPDFVESVKQYEKLVDPKVVPQTDGVIAIDTEFIRSIIKLTGPITLEKYKTTFSSEDNELGIPDFVYKLEYFVEKVFAGSEQNKKILGDFADRLTEAIFKLPSDKTLSLLETIIDNFEKKHLLAYFEDPKIQNFLERRNWAGRIHEFDGDYLHVNSSNLPGRKANLFVKYRIEQDIKIDKNGEIVKEVRITLKNTGKDDKWLNGRYNEWQRVYVPRGSLLLDKKYWRDFSQGKELGKTVFRSYTYVRPIEYSDNTSQIIYTYKLPFKLKEGETYKLLIQKQPGTVGHEFIIKINGKEKERFFLTTDKILEFEI